MIHIENKLNCCGCSACVQKCPKHCISMTEDEEGFLYPKMDTSECIDCGLCDTVCPIINQNKPSTPLFICAAKNPNDEVRMKSSSGGIFSILAEKIIDDNGVVFGVGYNEHWEAVHKYTETKEGLTAFRGSKYIQSIVGSTYKEAENFLKHGRKVLFSGTPCQIAGLKRYLRKEYDNLLTVDFICHGSPSPGVFRWYLKELFDKIKKSNPKREKEVLIPEIPKVDVLAKNNGIKIKDIRFRDKKSGWEKFSFVLEYSLNNKAESQKIVSFSELVRKNVFLLGFLNDLYLRPSCYNCPVRNFKSRSDITLGDFWGINEELDKVDDGKGVSAMMVNTSHGQDFVSHLKIDVKECLLDAILKHNPAMVSSPRVPSKREDFYKNKSQSLFIIVRNLVKLSFTQQLKHFICQIMEVILGKKKVNYIKSILIR